MLTRIHPVDDAFLEALADRLTVDDLCTYLDLDSADIVIRFQREIERKYSELAEIIGWTSISSGE
jgi:hypothetical protein